jgi:hypothetical protein
MKLLRSNTLVVLLTAATALVAYGCAQSEPDNLTNSTGTGGDGTDGDSATGAGGSGPSSTGTGGTHGRAGAGGSGVGGTTSSGGTIGAAGAAGLSGDGSGGRGGPGGSSGRDGAAGRGGAVGTGGKGGNGGRASEVGGASGGAAAPTFTVIYKSILTVYCAGSGCHIPGSQHGVGFSTQAAAYKSLSSVAIIPGNSQGSTFYTAVATGAMPYQRPMLSDAMIDDIGAWIDAGALDN